MVIAIQMCVLHHVQVLDERTLFVSDQPGFTSLSVKEQTMQIDIYDVGHEEPIFCLAIPAKSKTVPPWLQRRS
jgi:hypothetical protein